MKKFFIKKYMIGSEERPTCAMMYTSFRKFSIQNIIKSKLKKFKLVLRAMKWGTSSVINTKPTDHTSVLISWRRLK